MTEAEGDQRPPHKQSNRSTPNPGFEAAIEQSAENRKGIVGKLVKEGGAFTPQGNVVLLGIEKIPLEITQQLKERHIVRIEGTTFSNATNIHYQGDHRPLTHLFVVEPDFISYLAKLGPDAYVNQHLIRTSLRNPDHNPVGTLISFIGESVQQEVGNGARQITIERKINVSLDILKSLVREHEDSNPQKQLYSVGEMP